MTDAGKGSCIMSSKYGISAWKRGETHILVFDEKYWDAHGAQLNQDVENGKAFYAAPNKNGLKDKLPRIR